MTVFVFGNPDIDIDALPLRILNNLKNKFPEIEFKVLDPNEEWDIPKEMIILDTVLGIDGVKLFNNLEVFSDSPRISVHGFDAYFNLKYLKKLGKLKKIKIIGVSPTISKKEAIEKISSILQSI